MNDQLFTSIVSILTAVVGVAILATIVSKNAKTADVLTAGGSAFSDILGTALSPVTGSNGFSANNNTLQLN
jgi:hypothetical protein